MDGAGLCAAGQHAAGAAHLAGVARPRLVQGLWGMAQRSRRAAAAPSAVLLHPAAASAMRLATPSPCFVQAAKAEAAERAPVQTFDPEELEQMGVLWEKIRLQLAFASS